MFKKRIGNDITITWKIYRKNGEIKEPELFDGKDVIVELMSPSQRPAKIDNVSMAPGVVTFTFKGKNQHILGSYTAVLSENRGADGMVTIDTIEAITLVPYSYMEAFNRCENITASSVDIESEIDYSGGIAQQQADWAQTDDTAVNFIKNKPNLAKVAISNNYNDLDNRPTFDVEQEKETLIIF